MKEKVKNKMIVITFIFFFIITIYIVFLWPVKRPVELAVTDITKGIFLCIPQSMTGIDWAVIHEKDINKIKATIGLIGAPGLEIESIYLIGNDPGCEINHSFWTFKNKFIIKGKLLNKKINIGSDEYPELIRVIQVNDWDIIKPVMRDDFSFIDDRLIIIDFFNILKMKKQKELSEKFYKNRVMD